VDLTIKLTTSATCPEPISHDCPPVLRVTDFLTNSDLDVLVVLLHPGQSRERTHFSPSSPLLRV